MKPKVKEKVPYVAAGQFDVLYINLSGQALQAEVIGAGSSGGFNIESITEEPSPDGLNVDLSRPHFHANAVRVAIPDGHMLVAWGGEQGMDFKFQVLE